MDDDPGYHLLAGSGAAEESECSSVSCMLSSFSSSATLDPSRLGAVVSELWSKLMRFAPAKVSVALVLADRLREYT